MRWSWLCCTLYSIIHNCLQAIARARGHVHCVSVVEKHRFQRLSWGPMFLSPPRRSTDPLQATTKTLNNNASYLFKYDGCIAKAKKLLHHTNRLVFDGLVDLCWVISKASLWICVFCLCQRCQYGRMLILCLLHGQARYGGRYLLTSSPVMSQYFFCGVIDGSASMFQSNPRNERRIGWIFSISTLPKFVL